MKNQVQRLLPLLQATGLAIGLFTACQTDTFPTKEGTLQLNASISGKGIGTRAVMDEFTGVGTFATNDKIYLNTWQEDGKGGWVCPLLNKSIPYTLNGAVWEADPTKQIYWEDLGYKSTCVTAYFPSATVASPDSIVQHTVQTDQSTKANFDKSDLLFASSTSAGGAVDLTFNHILSRLTFNVSAVTDGGYTNENIKDVSVRIVGMKPTARLHTTTGQIEATGTVPVGGLIPLKLSKLQESTAAVSFSTLLVPQPVVEGAAWIELTLADKKKFTLNIPPKLANELTGQQEDFKALPSGKQLILNIKLSKQAVLLTSSYVGVWGDKGNHEDVIRLFPGIYTAQDLVDLSNDWESTANGKGAGTLSPTFEQNFVTNRGTADAVIKVWKDITFDEKTNAAFKPIGQTVAFTISFDGQGYTIAGLKIGTEAVPADIGDNVGLFGTAQGKLTNIHLRDCGIYTKGGNVGNIAGTLWTNMTNCTTTNCVIVSARYGCGSLAGRPSVNVLIENCAAIQLRIKAVGNTGGLAGWGDVLLKNCFSTGIVEASEGNVGGVCGFNGSGYVENSYSLCFVQGEGGIVGSGGPYGKTMRNTYFAGIVTKRKYPLTGPGGSSFFNCYWNDRCAANQGGAFSNSGQFSAITGLTTGAAGDVSAGKSILNLLNASVKADNGVNKYQYWELRKMKHWYLDTDGTFKETEAYLPALSGRYTE